MVRVALIFASVWLASGAAELGVGTRALLGHKDHSYKPHELVALYANKAGPFHNPRHVTRVRRGFFSRAAASAPRAWTRCHAERTLRRRRGGRCPTLNQRRRDTLD